MAVTISSANRRSGLLTEALVEKIPTLGMVAQQIFTPRAVMDPAGTIRQLKVSQLNVKESTKRGGTGSFKRINMQLGAVSYECVERAMEAMVDRAMKAEYASELDLLTAQSEQVATTVLIEQEEAARDAVFNTTTFPLSGNTGLDGATWTSAAADVLSDIQSAKKGIIAQSGLFADSIVMSASTYLSIWKNTGIRGSFSNGITAGLPDVDDEGAKRLLASVLGLPNIIVGKAIYSENHEEASPTMSAIWTDTYAFVFKKAPENMMQPGLGRLLHWATPDGGGAGLGIVERYISEEKRGEVVRYIQHCQEKITMAEAGFLLKID